MTFWPLTNSDLPTDQTFHQFHDLYTELDLHRIMSGFHGAFATGVASQQGTLTLPDTWFRPQFWDLLMLQLLRPNSSNLSCLYSTFHLEYPLVLSRFCFICIGWFELFTSQRKRELQNKKRLPTTGFEPTTSRLLHWQSYVLRYWGSDCRHLKVNDIHSHTVVCIQTSSIIPRNKYEKRLLLRCIHHFNSDLINTVDHMHISGTEPSSVFLSQTK